jgi:CheY-like chemotaxis protein
MSKKIILVDDNKTFLMYAGLLLKRFEFKVIPVQNGIEALKFLKHDKADAVMLDIHMEPVDGFTVLRYIKEDKGISNIPVMMVSVDSSSETIAKCWRLGCFDFLAKPLKIDKLHDSLQRCFFSHAGTNRKYIRASHNKKVVVTYEDTEYQLYTETLSEGGMYIRKEEPFPSGSEVTVRFSLEDGGVVELKGDVIYTKKVFGDFLTLPPGMAIAFKGVTEGDAATLKSLLEDLLARDIFDSQEEEFFKQSGLSTLPGRF